MIRRMMAWGGRILVLGILASTAACKEKSAGPPLEARDRGVLKPSTQPGMASTAPAGSVDPSAMSLLPVGHPPIGGSDASGALQSLGSGSLPAGHPPIGGSGLPADHPPIGGTPGQTLAPPPAGSEPEMLDFRAPDDWVSKPAKYPLMGLYTLPKVEGDAEDAELRITFFPEMKDVSMADQVQRWAGQFRQSDGSPLKEIPKPAQVQDAAHPTSIVDLSGQYRAGSMFGPPAAPKDNYRMLTAVIESPAGPWFLKLVGPAKTIAHHEEAFIKFAREAK